MEIEVFNKKYEVLEIIPKKHEEYDLFVCRAPAGYKECFQRIDIGREPKKINMTDSVSWTYGEIHIIKEAIKKGVSYIEIPQYKGLERHTENAIRSRYSKIKREMLWKEESERERKKGPRFNIKF